MKKKEYNEAIERVHYRLPLKLVTSYNWAKSIKPARAILPVLGVYANKGKVAFINEKTIAELAGYKDLRYRKIREGIEDLIKNELVVKLKEGRRNFYIITDLAWWEEGRVWFPIYKVAMILSGKWVKLTPCEKSLYPVLGNKIRILHPDVLDSEFYGAGNIYKINQFIELAGISRPSFYSAYYGLNHNRLIKSWGEEDPYEYGIYAPQ